MNDLEIVIVKLTRRGAENLVCLIDAARDGKAQGAFLENRGSLWVSEFAIRESLGGWWQEPPWGKERAGNGLSVGSPQSARSAEKPEAR